MRYWYTVDENGDEWIYSGNLPPVYSKITKMWESNKSDYSLDNQWFEMSDSSIVEDLLSEARNLCARHDLDPKTTPVEFYIKLRLCL